MQVSIVVAAAENDTIGADGGIPWKLPADQRRFKALTVGHTLIMGRRTHESIGRLLPGRSTIVLSSRPGYAIPGAEVSANLEAALALAKRRGESEAFVVGGAHVYALAVPLAHRIELTRVHAQVPGDTHFPDEARLRAAGFVLEAEEAHRADERNDHAYTFQTWTRPAASSD